MLYGNIIFIKKTGGDGSKFPVTEKSIKIGRSEACLIRIYNPQVAPEHCQLIIENNGQAILRSLSNQTILNGKSLDQKDVTLCHGDIFQLGERMARWEYIPTSKYYKQLLSPTGRLVAVVIPQQRSMDSLKNSGTSTQVSEVKNTPLGKRRYSEKNKESPALKMLKSNELELSSKFKSFPKILTGQHSVKSTKLLLQNKMPRERKSLSGIAGLKTPQKTAAKSRKSTLPSWRVKLVSPSEKKSVKSKTSLSKTPQSTKLSPEPKVRRSAVKETQLKINQDTKYIKEILKSKGSSVSKMSRESLFQIEEENEKLKHSSRKPSSPKELLISSSKSLFSTPKQKSSKLDTQVHSESKLNTKFNTHSLINRGKRMSLVLDKLVIDSEQIKKISKKDLKKRMSEKISDITQQSKFNIISKISQNNVNEQKSAQKTPTRKSRKSLKRNSSKKSRSPTIKTDRKSFNIKTPKGIKGSNISNNYDTGINSSTPQSKNFCDTPKKRSSTSSKINLSTSSQKISTTIIKSSPQVLETSVNQKSKTTSKSHKRKLSPTFSAEEAAKKLKTSDPKKLDKNKKAALLVLGKANRKQNVMFLKQKILKKAIKQSTAVKSDNKTQAGKLKKKIQTKESKFKSKPIKKAKVSQKTLKSSTNSDTKSSKTTGEQDVICNLVSSTEKIKSSLLTQTPGTYLFNSNRRISKRLSSKNDTGRPDFIELSPTALGLIPKNVEFFNTPPKKNVNRRSLSLTTPKNFRSVGIIKAASTSKIGNRKSVRFSSKDLSVNSEFCSPVVTEKTDYDFSSYRTPDLGLEVFVSPISGQKNFEKSEVSLSEDAFNDSTHIKTYIRKLLLPPSNRNSAGKKNLPKNTHANKSKLMFPDNLGDSSIEAKVTNLQTNISNISDIDKLFASPETQKNSRSSSLVSTKATKTSRAKSPKNDLSDVRGVKKLLRTPKAQKSPKNDLSDVKGVKKLLRTPKEQKSPKNDLSDVRGVKKLLRTPKAQRSPKNDLSDVRGVKKLLRTPKEQKSPKNDLSDVRGVKKLLATPKAQKSPKNDLSDVRGVKKLLRTPKEQKSPKNDLSDVRGVKKLLRTPKTQKSPKNDLSDVRGVKKLLGTPKTQKSPKNDLSDVRGVKKLLGTPKTQKSPKNDLSDVRGVKKLLRTPKEQKSPKNDLSDVRGVKKLLRTPKAQKSPKNDLSDLTGVKELFSSGSQKSPTDNLLHVSGIVKLFESPNAQEVTSEMEMSEILKKSKDTETKQKSGSKNRKGSVINKNSIDTKLIKNRGRRTINLTPKRRNNNSPDVTGVRELFLRHEPSNDLEISLTKVFATPERMDVSTTSVAGKDASVTRRGRPRKNQESGVTELPVTRSGRKRGRPPKTDKSEELAEIGGLNSSRNSLSENLPKKRGRSLKTQSKTSSEESPNRGENFTEEENKNSRKRSKETETVQYSPPKLRRRTATIKSTSPRSGALVKASAETKSKKNLGESKKGAGKRVAKVEEKVKKVQSETENDSKSGKTQKVQSRRSQKITQHNISDSETKSSPIKTRSARVKTNVKSPVNKAVKSNIQKKKSSAAVKSSGRKK